MKFITKNGRFSAAAVLGVCMWLSACGNSAPALYATLTLKSDGSHFAGTVARRETNSITITSAGGDSHTFLYSELADIKYGAPDDHAVPAGQLPASAAKPSDQSEKAVMTSGAPIVIPAGTEVPVRTRGFLDSCCGAVGGLSLGTTDADVRVGGKVVLPAGASVTMERVDSRQADGQVSLSFELRSADFQDRHYLFEASESGVAHAGILVTIAGARSGSQEAKDRGPNVHLESQSFMGFKATVPVQFRLSE